MISVALTMAALYGLLVAALYLGQRRLMYFPDQSTPDPARWGVADMTAIRLPVGGGLKILAWWRPPADSRKPVIVYFHGNADHIGDRAYKARRFIDAGYGILLTTYRYNAGSGGRPSEEALIDDASRAVDFVVSEGVTESRIVLYGESLGSGVAVALAAERKVAGLILETPYSSVVEIAHSRYWFALAKWLVHDRYDSMARIGEVKAPILLLHGEADTTIPVHYGRKLFEAAPEPKEGHFIAGGQHTDLYDFGAGQIVIDFLNRLSAGGGAREAKS